MLYVLYPVEDYVSYGRMLTFYLFFMCFVAYYYVMRITERCIINTECYLTVGISVLNKTVYV